MASIGQFIKSTDKSATSMRYCNLLKRACALRSVSSPTKYSIISLMRIEEHRSPDALTTVRQSPPSFPSQREVSPILAERVRKVGGTTIRSIGHIARLQRVEDNDKDYVSAIDMLCELMSDNKAQIEHMRQAHKVADQHEDEATARLLETFIGEDEKRCWFLFEASREAERGGH